MLREIFSISIIIAQSNDFNKQIYGDLHRKKLRNLRALNNDLWKNDA